MTRHATVETLSTYLDTELVGEERTALEEHLERCDACRRRLDGLRRVVVRLDHLKRTAPPEHLGRLVEQRIRLEADHRGPFDRFESRLQLSVQSSIFSVFALVVALAVIIYLFAHGLERTRRGTRVILNPEMHQIVETRQVEGRTFERVDDVWVEEGLAAEEPVRSLDISAAVPGAKASLPPDLAPFAVLGGRVRLRTAEGVVEVRFAEPAGGG